MKQQKWNINEIEDQQGRVAIVTGSSSGIGAARKALPLPRGSTPKGGGGFYAA